METDSTSSLLTTRSSRSPFATTSIIHTSPRLLSLSLAALKPSTQVVTIQSDSHRANRNGIPREHPPHVTRSGSLDVAPVAHSPAVKMVVSGSESGNDSSAASDGSSRKRLPDASLQSLIETSDERTRERLPDEALETLIDRSKVDASKTILDQSLHNPSNDHASPYSHPLPPKPGRHFGGPDGLPKTKPGNADWIGRPEHHHAQRYDQQTGRPSWNNRNRTMNSYVPSYSFDFRPTYDESGPHRLRAWPATQRTTPSAPRDALSTTLAKVSLLDLAPGIPAASSHSNIPVDPGPPSSSATKRKRPEDFFADDDAESKDRRNDKPPQEYQEKRLRPNGPRGRKNKAQKAKEAEEKAASLAFAAERR